LGVGYGLGRLLGCSSAGHTSFLGRLNCLFRCGRGGCSGLIVWLDGRRLLGCFQRCGGLLRCCGCLFECRIGSHFGLLGCLAGLSCFGRLLHEHVAFGGELLQLRIELIHDFDQLVALRRDTRNRFGVALIIEF
jgi:hypothetical protein